MQHIILFIKATFWKQCWLCLIELIKAMKDLHKTSQHLTGKKNHKSKARHYYLNFNFLPTFHKTILAESQQFYIIYIAAHM